ncbi:hypothetical protein [Fructobacillus cardui]|uniref:hypothetical protein n=1 Tax=Fructobacillus cardui TaxID=2893170 RepID=UPI002D9E92C4|nr:unnamed protein product [Fructobacillus cardui]
MSNNPVKKVEFITCVKVSVEVLNTDVSPHRREAWIEYFDGEGNLIGIIRPD